MPARNTPARAMREALNRRGQELRERDRQRLPTPAPPGQPMRGSKRRSDEPPDDPRTQQTDQPETVHPRGTKRSAEDPPDDPRTQNTDNPDVIGSVDKTEEEHKTKCATCGQKFPSRNQLHRHIRKEGHRWKGAPPIPSDVAQQMRDHFQSKCDPNEHDLEGSVKESPPDTDETGGGPLSDQHASGQTARESKPVCSVGHPGPIIKEEELGARDGRWTDVGSGVLSRVFKGATHFVTTSKSGPPMSDIKMRRVEFDHWENDRRG